MFSSGVSGDSHNSTTPAPPNSRAFARPRGRRARLRNWLAGLPLIAVAVFTMNGPAPAETSSDIVAPVVAQQTARWSQQDLQTLLRLVEASASQGLDPADYQVAALRRAVNGGGQGPASDLLANAAALSLAHDYAGGRVDDKAAFDWHMAAAVDSAQLATALDAALDKGQLAEWLPGLLPTSTQYIALQAAYAATPAGDSATRDQLRANLERWRWMPRALGERYIYVNVPAYRLQLMNAGVEEASFNVVVGAPKTPTPQLFVQARSVVANPSWTLPPTVLKEGKWQNKGFNVTRRSDGSLRVIQAPGPRNALGRIKIDMPNPMSIYLHDTPNKAAFNREDRALSHGCVRVQNIEALAALLKDDGQVEDALADPSTTRTLQLEKSVPVYIAYFTAEADPDGSVRLLDDPYGHDQALLARLGGLGGSSVRVAAR